MSPRLCLALAVGATLAACGGGDEPAADPGPPVTELTITSTKTEFDVQTFAVPAGEEITVTYDNRHAGVDHNVEFDLDDGRPETSVERGPDLQSVSFTVERPGEFDYLCEVHPNEMRGTLVVVEDPAVG